jgi:propionyl-CoA carboxylase alpha chain
VLANGRVVTVHRWSDTDLDLDIDGVRRVASVSAAGGHIHVSLDSTTVSLAVTPRFAPPGSDTPTGGLVAPMPGIVLELRCAEGDQVAAGQVLVVLEAMKMEHHIAAPIAGVVSSLLIAEGQQLENGALLLTIEPPPMGGGDG